MAKTSSNMSIVQKAESVLRTPTKFFTSVQKEKGLKAPFVYLAVVSFISALLNYFFNPMLKLFAAPFGPGIGFAAIIGLWIAGLILSFIFYGFFHLFVMLLGGKGGYENTYKVFAYSSTPSSLLGWIAGIFFGFGLGGIVVGGLIYVALIIWALYLFVTGLSIVHKMTKLRALAVILIPVVILAILVIAIVALVAVAYVTSGAIPA